MKPLTDNIGAQACSQTGTTTTINTTSTSSSSSSSSSSSNDHLLNSTPDIIAMASSLAHENNSYTNGSSINSNISSIKSNSSNTNNNQKSNKYNGSNNNTSSQQDPENNNNNNNNNKSLKHLNGSSTNTAISTITTTTTKMPSPVTNTPNGTKAASSPATSPSSKMTNGNSAPYSNGHATPTTTSDNGTKHSKNNNNNTDTNNKGNHYHNSNGNHHSHRHHNKNYKFPQHSPNNSIDPNACVAAAAAEAFLNLPESEDSRPVFLEYSSIGGHLNNNQQPEQQQQSNTQDENSSTTTTTTTTSNNGTPTKMASPKVKDDHRNDLLTSINTLRKQGQFCDIKLLVEEHEIPAHRAVLATSSPYLFDFLSCLEESECLQPCYRIKDVPYVGFQHLLDYMYTGKLEVPLSQVPVVYGTALALRMETPARVCADFLSCHLTEANCLVIRRFSRDNEFRSAVDEYIKSHMEGILGSKSFFGLTNLQVEVVGLDESIEDETMERRLFSLVLDWAKTNLNDLKPKMDRLTEQVNVLYLNPDNTLMDCADMEDSVISSDDDVVIDYKKMARRRSKTKPSNPHTMGASSANGISGGQNFHKFSLNPEEAVSVAEREWSIIATRKTNENAYLSIAVLDGKLMAVSIHVRPPAPASTDGNTSFQDPDSPTSVGNSSGARGSSPTFRKASIAPLETMSTARCAMGAVALDGQIVVFGGYDRGECLQSVESFSLQDNQWSSLSPMKAARGRFSAAAIGEFVYTCGGSDGWKELSCVERFEPSTGEWKHMTSMIKERSSHGVATLNGKLYCVGGSDGQRSIADCEVYDPETNKWSRIAPLNMVRAQTCVCAFQGLLYAIGGTDSWNTLNSVEVYDPSVGEWVLDSTLNITRRGAGIDIVDGAMVVVGGSDGVQSLTSTELYNPETSQWTMGSPMLTPRANLSAVTVGSRLFAIGGFSGKKFLSTVEWLDMEDKEWLGHAPRVVDLDGSSGNGSGEEGEEEKKK